MTECVLWKDNKSTDGYGVIHFLAHRFVYELLVGKIPKDHDLHHKCKNRLCVNPYHLEPLTHSKHMSITPNQNTKKIHCKRNHRFTEDNTYKLKTKNGKIWRACRKCRKINLEDRLHLQNVEAQKK